MKTPKELMEEIDKRTWITKVKILEAIRQRDAEWEGSKIVIRHDASFIHDECENCIQIGKERAIAEERKKWEVCEACKERPVFIHQCKLCFDYGCDTHENNVVEKALTSRNAEIGKAIDELTEENGHLMSIRLIEKLGLGK